MHADLHLDAVATQVVLCARVVCHVPTAAVVRYAFVIIGSY